MAEVGIAAPGISARCQALGTAACLFVLVYVLYGAIGGHGPVKADYFVPLAEAFLHGRLYLEAPSPHLNELVPVGDRWYVVFPPVPALLLLPFVAVAGPTFNQGEVSLAIGAVNAVLVFAIARRAGLSWGRQIFFALLFAFGTIHWFSATRGTAWHFAHVCGLMFMLSAIWATLSGGRPVWIGVLVGLAALCRLPMLLSVPFFMVALARTPAGGRQAAQVLAGLALPIAGYLAYNTARFGGPLTLGYEMIPRLLSEPQYRHGFLSVQAIGGNLHAMFLKVPQWGSGLLPLPPRTGGLSLLLTTPFFLWALRAPPEDWLVRAAWLAVLLPLVPILLHGDTGGFQFGYRYALDVYPFFLLLTMRGAGDRFTAVQLLAFAVGLVVNLWGMGSTLAGRWA